MNHSAKDTARALGCSLDLFDQGERQAGEIFRTTAGMELLTERHGEGHHLGALGEV